MMNGHEKSDSVIVAVKPTNKAERSAAESAEPRTGTKGNAGQQSTCRAQNRVSVSEERDRMRQALAAWTRGKSCTYGSVRGPPAMEVPTATGGSSSRGWGARWRGRWRRGRSSRRCR